MPGIAFEFLDVGMGDGTLIEMPPWDKGPIVLVDFGEKNSPSKIPVEDATMFLINEISEICHNKGLTEPVIDHLFITHPDEDHYNKLGDLIYGVAGSRKNLWESVGKWKQDTRLKITNLTFGGKWDDYNKKLTENIEENLSNPIKKLGDGDHDGDIKYPRWKYGGANIYLLSSNLFGVNSKSANPKSLVLMFEYKGYKVILPGDAGEIVENKIINNYPADFLKSFGLKLGHHGSKTSTCEAWVKIVKPKAIFASADQMWGHPYCEVINRVKKADSLLKITKGTNKNTIVSPTEYHWYTCMGEKDYQNQETSDAICPNLWYVVTEDPRGKRKSNVGNFSGVQWRLEFVPDYPPGLSYAPEKTVVPLPKN